MRRIFWDTMIFAYWLEDHGRWGKRVAEVHADMMTRGDRLCSSLFVLGELLVGPLRTGDDAAADAVEGFFQSGAVELLPFPANAVHMFATLRARDGVKALDALHLATAGTAGVDAFLTNDRRLKNVHVPGISFILPLDSDLL